MNIKLGELAAAVRGEVRGDDNFQVTNLAALHSAAADSLSFYADVKLRKHLPTTRAGAVMLRAADADLFAGHKLITAEPKLSYARISQLFARELTMQKPGVHPTAVVAATARVHPTAIIGAHVTLGDECIIGAHTEIHSGAVIYARTTIGARCVISSGAVIGAPGFGYAQDENHRWIRIEQLGGVVIGDDVDVGANTTIDRGALHNTIIGRGVKLDNHIQIAHNVQVGDDTIMAACVAVAGGAVIGRRCKIGGRAGILGHLRIADDVRINADTFVGRSITEPGEYSAMWPARPANTWRKFLARTRRDEK